MSLLERERTPDPEAPAVPQVDAAAPASEEAAARACASCGAQLEPGQDWCLNCGAAATTLGERPGWRAAMTVLGLTLVLVAGAVAAAYAALRDDAPQPPVIASNPAAQPPAATPAPTTPGTTPTTPGATGEGETSTLPEVTTPGGTSTGSTPAPRSVDPAPSPPSSTPSVTPSPSPSTGSGTGSSGSSSSTGSARSQTPTTTTPQTPPAERIELGRGAASVYDPYGRAVSTGDPARAIDGEGGTSWYVDTAPGTAPIGVGLALDVGETRGIRRVEITTPTPGFRVEVYATDEATPPPNILDTRWAHITDRANVGAGRDGPERIVLGAGTSKYRTLLLWITRPPESGARVRITEVKIFG